jgi:urease accessory protein
MIINEKVGNLQGFNSIGYQVDWLPLEWYETGKRILHKQTAAGRNVVLKFLKEAPQLQQDDIIFKDENSVIVIDILPCEVIVVQPATMYEMAVACYEIGNKHLPLFYEGDAILIPYEAPLLKMLQSCGFTLATEQRKLLHPLKTSVAPHLHGSSNSLFSKILQLTSNAS